MVKYAESQLDAVFSALRDGTRRAILLDLARHPRTVTEVAAPFGMSLPAVSKHLTVLERAGLIRKQRDGRRFHCGLEPGRLRQANEWLEQYRQFWEGSLESLDEYFAQMGASHGD